MKDRSRRLIRAGLLIVAVAAIGATARAEQPNNRSKVEFIKKIKELIDGAKDLIEWTEWSEDAGLAIGNGRAPPAAPGSVQGERIESILRKQLADAKALELPDAPGAIDPPSIDAGANRDEIRMKIRAAISRTLAIKSWTTDAERQILQIGGVIKRAELVKRGLQTVVAIYGDLVATVPHYQVYLSATVNISSIEGTYLQLNGDLRTVLAQKTQDMRKEISRRATGASAEINKLIDAIRIEQSLLKIDEDYLKLQQQLLEERRRGLIQRNERERTQSAALNTIDAEVSAARLDHQNCRDLIEQWSTEIERARTDIQWQQVRLGEPYNRCPNKHPYHKCEHHELKRAWNQDRSNNERRIGELRALIQARERDRDEQVGRKARLERLIAELHEKKSKAENTLQELRSQTEVLRLQLMRDTEQLEQTKWQSRADLYANQSRQDESAARDVLSSLSR